MAKKRKDPTIIRPDDIDPHYQVGPPAAGARAHAGRFRGAHQLPAPARLSPGSHTCSTRRFRSWRAALLRSAQHPLHHKHRHWRMGARQAHALFAADRQRRPLYLGLRLGRQASPSACAVAAPRPLPCRTAGIAGRRRRRHNALSRRRARRSRRSSMPRAWPIMPLGLDVVEPPMLFELQKQGIEVRDGQQTCCRRARSRASTS